MTSCSHDWFNMFFVPWLFSLCSVSTKQYLLALVLAKEDSRIHLDGAYYCYCAYVLPISRYSDFLSSMLTNIGIFLRGLKLSGESRS